MNASGRRRTLTIDLRKLTHSGIGRYLANIVPGTLPLIAADCIQLIGKPHEIEALGRLPANTAILPDASAPHSLHEQGYAFDGRIQQIPGATRLLWVPHYNIPFLFRGPLVCTVHDMAPVDLPENFGAAKRMLARVLLQQVARRASALLTPSHYSRERIQALLHYPEEKICVTPLAVDRNWPAAENAPQPYRLQDSPAEPYLLFVGNLKPNKNLTTLLEALQRLGEAAPRLLVAGKTAGFRTADDRASALASQLGDRVRLLGAVSEDELIALYRGAAAFVMPSLYEGFGLPILEAMRYGCPVISSDSTSLPEVAGDAALLFDPRDAAALAQSIRTVLQPDVARRLSQAGMAREAHFRYDDTVRKTAGVLNHILETAA